MFIELMNIQIINEINKCMPGKLCCINVKTIFGGSSHVLITCYNPLLS